MWSPGDGAGQRRIVASAGPNAPALNQGGERVGGAGPNRPEPRRRSSFLAPRLLGKSAMRRQPRSPRTDPAQRPPALLRTRWRPQWSSLRASSISAAAAVAAARPRDRGHRQSSLGPRIAPGASAFSTRTGQRRGADPMDLERKQQHPGRTVRGVLDADRGGDGGSSRETTTPEPPPPHGRSPRLVPGATAWDGSCPRPVYSRASR